MKRRILFITICILFLSGQLVYAMGLSTTFGQVRVDNVKIGQTYSMEKDAETPLIIKNTSDIELALKIDVLKPKENELIEECEAIPDTSWITLEQNSFVLPPKNEISTDVIISIPDEERYKGKRYQVYIWSHTTGSIAVGLKSKLLISIAK